MAKTGKKELGAWIGLALFLSACSPGHSDSQPNTDPNAQNDTSPVAHQSEVEAQLSMRMDPSLSRDERSLVIGDLYQMLQYQISVDPDSLFAAAFGSTTNDGVIQYLNDRVSLIVDASVDPQTRLGVSDATKTYIVAANIGVPLWFEALLYQPETLFFQVGDREIPINSSRVGIVQLGEGYTARATDGQYEFSTMKRIGTIIHEARHSDCTGGMDTELLESIETKNPLRPDCGHLHVDCPSRIKEYAGLKACDDEPWGAYAIQALYAANLETHCTNCSSSDIAVAHAIAADSLLRVLPEQSGRPDMSSDSIFRN